MNKFEDYGIKIGISGRHIHLDEETYVKLFGDKELEKLKDLRQPGEFASTDTVDLKVGDNVIKNVRILGPLRDNVQLEISYSDARKLKIKPPVCNSGQQVSNSFSYTLITDLDEVQLNKNCIIARAHIHLDTKTANELGVSDKQSVSIDIETSTRKGQIGNVFCRVSKNYLPELHLDTDEAACFMISSSEDEKFSILL